MPNQICALTNKGGNAVDAVSFAYMDWRVSGVSKTKALEVGVFRIDRTRSARRRHALRHIKQELRASHDERI